MAMTLIEPERVTPAERAATAVRAARAAGRVTIDDGDWPLYDALLDEIGDEWPRVTYDDGHIELEMPHDPHEMLKKVIATWVEAYMEEQGVDHVPVGSTTWRRRDVRSGLEPDECYYIQSYADVVATTPIDLSIHPPPDLCVEIDISRPTARRAFVYAQLGVPEVWRWNRDGLAVLELRPDGSGYDVREGSVALPGFPLDRLAEELARTPHAGRLAALREFRAWCRDHAGD